MPSVGPGVIELRDEDARAWYRVMYVRRVANAVHVLYCFEKKTRRTAQKDIDTARERLSQLEQGLRKEQTDAKRRSRNQGKRS
jgi:phage-related protein